MRALWPTRPVRPTRAASSSRTLRDRDAIVWIGTLLVLALVAILPLALALVSADGATDDVGIGSGAGELSAAALSALHRDLNTKREPGDVLPAHDEVVVPPFLAAWACLPAGVFASDRSSHDPSHGRQGPPLPVPAPAGPGADGIPLRL